MKLAEFQLLGLGDPRLAVHATSIRPAWLWSADGARVLWANPVGARLFAASAAELAAKSFGPADPHRRQVAQLARTLPLNGAVRLERLRGFGAPLGGLMTCGCARLEFPDGSQGILVTAAEPAGRGMPLVERLQLLVDGVDLPIAAFASDGMFVGASEAARPLLGFRDLTEAGLDEARHDALAKGRVEMGIGIGHMVLQRVGTGADIGLVALLAPGATQSAHVRHHASVEPPPPGPAAAPPPPDYEHPEDSGEAPAEFALLGEVGEVLAEPVPETPAPVKAEEPAAAGRQPLQFMWQMDADGRFSLGSDEFTRLIGPHTAAALGRRWHEIAESFHLDPEGRIDRAVATRQPWSGIAVKWPVDGGERLPVELTGLPVYDPARNFAGYRGFGVCHDLDALARLDALRRFELFDEPPSPPTPPAEMVEAGVGESFAAELTAAPESAQPAPPEVPSELPEQIIAPSSREANLQEPVETPQNVVPFRPPGEAKTPALTPVENSAFNELARQLSERLEREGGPAVEPAAAAETQEAPSEPLQTPVELLQAPVEPPPAPAEWLAPAEPAPRGESRRDRALLDLLPNGVLIYRLDRLLYANPSFLKQVGYSSLHALEDAGGLDALYVAPGVSSASSTSEAGTPVTIAASAAAEQAASAVEGRLHTIDWDGESALALIFAPGAGAAAAAPVAEPVAAAAPPEPGHAQAEDLAAILDTTAEGVLMFDAEGNIHACNRSAEALFGYDGEELCKRNLVELFAPESHRMVQAYLESIKGADIGSLLEQGREALGRVRGGGIIALAMTMGRTRPEGPSFFAVFRDLSQSKKGESELREARRLADRAANAKADMLARISHEVRTPLNAIIGFAEVMISERFGALGNERYVEYMKDIRASGERVIAIIDDLLELSRIETGKLDLSFISQNLNDLVESCVAVMQPQANRERIIIRTSLAHALPPVVADARALKQIALNLIGNSIHLAKAGGQVIVSTALTDRGEVALRVRDTGHGLNDNEVAAALEPFRTPPPPDQAGDSAAVSLSLTKALVEANRAQFHIRTGGRSGTLVEVVFPRELARA